MVLLWDIKGCCNVFRSNIPSIKRQIKQKAKESMEKVVNDLTRRSKQLAPLDTGDLRGAGEGDVEIIRNNVIGTVTFDKEYAMKQHEDMTFKHPRGGQAKYLEQPLNQNRRRYKQFIADKVKEVTE